MLNELLKKSRSIRSFKPGEKVSREMLLKMIETTRLCPSTANLQALKFRPVYEDDECSSVLENIKWAGYLPEGTLPPKGHESTAYIIICLDREISTNAVAFGKDTGICAQTMLLSATENGYGGCMIGSFNKENISKALSLPENLEIMLVLALGVPDEAPVTEDSRGDIKYYRRDGVQHVPKRTMEEIVVK